MDSNVFLGATLLEAGQGGIAAVARMSIRALREAGFVPHVTSFLDDKPLDTSGAPMTAVKGHRFAFAWRCHAAALRHQRFIYDSVGMARAHPRFWPLKRPYAVWMHGIEVWWNLHPDPARALRNADLVLVNSHFTLRRFEELHWPLPNAHVCPLATEEDEPPEERADFSGPPTVLILGRQDKDNYYKGHRELIECWPEVVSAVPDARLVIAGGGDGLPLTRKLVARSPAAEYIDVLGFVPDEELPALWKRTHVFAMPSRGEGFGIVYAEAMRYGLPVIASVHDAGQEVNRHGETGYNVDLDRPGDLTARLIELLSDPDKACGMGKAAFAYWQQHYRYGAFAERFIKILKPFLA